MGKPCDAPWLCIEAQVYQALADPTRLAILRALACGPLCVNDLAAALAISQPTASRHLKVLRELKLLRADRDGPKIIYALVDARITELTDLLRQIMSDAYSSDIDRLDLSIRQKS